MGVSRLHLIAPGLLGPVPAEAADTLYAEAPGHAETALLLARAGRVVRSSPRQTLAERLFTLLRGPADGMAPVAPYRALGDGIAVGRRAVFCADPLRLVPDRDQLRAFDPGSVQLSAAALEPFLQAFHHHFADDGLELRCGPSGRWYLLAERMPAVTLEPIEAVYGRSLGQCLPQGPEAGTWIGLLNAVQMLLHEAPFNQQRESAGLAPITGLWFWGGGVMNAAPPVSPAFDTVFSDDPLTRGLSASAGLACEPASSWPTTSRPVAGQDERLLLQTPTLPAVADAESFQRWQRALDAWCGHWGPPLLQRLHRREVGQLVLESGGRQFLLGPRSLRAIWRRPRQLSHWLLRT